MRLEYTLIAIMMAAIPGIASSLPNAPDAPTQMVVTVHPSANGSPSQKLEAGDVKVTLGRIPARVVNLQRLTGNRADMQLFILLDDSLRSSALGTQLPDLKKFVESLPPSTQVAIGYMRNGTFGPVQAFTTDHEQAARSLRLPESIPGGNGSPYFALSDLAKHWPSKQPTDRRAVLMLTDGVDRYYGTGVMDDPYVDTSIRDALKDGLMVYSIYFHDAGLYGRGGWVTNFAQSRLSQVSQETGGYAYFQDFTDPVSIAPFLKDFQNRLDNQYQVTIAALNEKGIQPVKVRTEVPALKLQAPTHIYVQ